jgi:hypothetical protein
VDAARVVEVARVDEDVDVAALDDDPELHAEATSNSTTRPAWSLVSMARRCYRPGNDGPDRPWMGAMLTAG